MHTAYAKGATCEMKDETGSYAQSRTLGWTLRDLLLFFANQDEA